MPRKTDIGLVSAATMQAAVEQVILGGAAATVARTFGIDLMTLKRYVKKR